MIHTTALAPAPRSAVRALAAAVADHDGVAALDEAALLALDGDAAHHLLLEESGALIGYAGVLADGTLQGMVDPAHRRRGHGSALLRAALAHRPDAGVWAHGALEGSLAFLSAAGLHEVRRLLTLRRDLGSPADGGVPADGSAPADGSTADGSAPAVPPLPQVPASTLEGLRRTTFDVARDAERWVEVNARAFASHPEQGALTRADLDQRLSQPWFRAEDMHVALRDEELVGFVWVKREDRAGTEGAPGAAAQPSADAEIYVVATDPSVQGHGVAAVLMQAALQDLQEQGVRGVELYVEADNAPALRLYEAWGFTVAGRDVQMRATEQG